MRRESPLAFTLIELLVVVTIIISLLAILMPSMNRAVLSAEEAVCAADLSTIGKASLSYAADAFGHLPRYEGASHVYIIHADSRRDMEQTYGLSRQHWYATTMGESHGADISSWNNDLFYGYDGTGPDTYNGQVVVGRFLFTSDRSQNINFKNFPPGAQGKPKFPQRVADNAHWNLLAADMNREWPNSLSPNAFDWTRNGALPYGASHLYGPPMGEPPAGAHEIALDASVFWVDGADLVNYAAYNNSDLYW